MDYKIVSRISFLRSLSWNLSMSSEIITQKGFQSFWKLFLVRGRNICLSIFSEVSHSFVKTFLLAVCSLSPWEYPRVRWGRSRVGVRAQGEELKWGFCSRFSRINFSKVPDLLSMGCKFSIQYFKYISFSIAIFWKSIASSLIKKERQNFPAWCLAVFRCPKMNNRSVMQIRTVQRRFFCVIIKRSISESLWHAFIARELQTQIQRIHGIFEK